MKLTTFAAGFVAACVVVAGATLLLHPPSTTSVGGLPAAPTAPPTTWPDYSSNGPGFIAPVLADGDLIAYGYKLVAATYAIIGPEVPDIAMRFAGNSLACQNCHLDGGTKRGGLPLVGVFRTYPKFSTRSSHDISLAERIDECMTRSMNGRKLPGDSREMAAILAYLRFIGEPQAAPSGPAPAPPLPASAERGAEVLGRVCATCHQPDGLGRRRGSSSAALGYEFPPLWGPDSFNDGAGMDHFERAVGFIQHNMPRGVDPAKPQLSLQQAWDAAALLQSRPRPHYASAR
jgi:thiosulfate dehydrogenase